MPIQLCLSLGEAQGFHLLTEASGSIPTPSSSSPSGYDCAGTGHFFFFSFPDKHVQDGVRAVSSVRLQKRYPLHTLSSGTMWH